MRLTSIAHEFVESIPCELESGVLYISIDFRTTMHLCACGCGNEVVLPLRPAAWSLTYDGVDVSMSPSVGNWSFECLSHYWIRRSQVEWASDWSDQQIASGRQRTLVERGRHSRSACTRTRPTEVVAEDHGERRRRARATKSRPHAMCTLQPNPSLRSSTNTSQGGWAVEAKTPPGPGRGSRGGR